MSAHHSRLNAVLASRFFGADSAYPKCRQLHRRFSPVSEVLALNFSAVLLIERSPRQTVEVFSAWAGGLLLTPGQSLGMVASLQLLFQTCCRGRFRENKARIYS